MIRLRTVRLGLQCDVILDGLVADLGPDRDDEKLSADIIRRRHTAGSARQHAHGLFPQDPALESFQGAESLLRRLAVRTQHSSRKQQDAAQDRE